MKALKDYLLLRVSKPEDKTVSGIIVKQEPVNYFKGTVISVGEELNEDKIGKTIYFNTNSTRISMPADDGSDDMLVVIKADSAMLEE